MYLKRVEDVLGKGWESHIEGQKLKADGDSFRAKLNIDEVFQEWARKVQERNFGSTGRIFTIDSARSRLGKGNILKLRVNFLPEIITLSKEVRNIKNLSFRYVMANTEIMWECFINMFRHLLEYLWPLSTRLIRLIRYIPMPFL